MSNALEVGPLSSNRRRKPGSAARPTRGGRPSLELSFRSVLCTRCGDRRVATQTCPSCGKAAQPGEYDPKAQRRRNAALLLQAGEVVTDPPAPTQPFDLEATLDGLGDLPSRLVAALDGLDAGGPREATGLAAAAAVLDELRSACAELDKDWPRPWRRYARAAREPVKGMQDALRCLIDAYAAADVGSAQAQAEQVQVLLDSAALHANSLGDELSFAAAVLGLPDSDLLSECIARELDKLGVSTGGFEALLALDEAGRRRLTVLTGAGTPGMGLQVQAVLLPAAILLDPDALLALCNSAHALLRRDAFLSLTQDPAWTVAQRAATTALLDACQRLARLADLPERPVRQDVRDALLFMQDLVEGPLRHLLATVLACAAHEGLPGNRYAAARGNTGGGVVNTARQHLPAEFTRDVSVMARHASAHLDFVVEPDGVLLQASKGDKATHVDFESLTDAVLAVLETALALQLAVLAACDAENLLPDDTDLLDEVDPDLLSKFVLASIGWRNVVISRDGHLLRVTGDSSLRSPLPTIGMLLSRLGDDINDVELEARDEDRIKSLTAKTAPFRRWSNRPDPDDEFESQLLFMDALAGVRFDGVPVVDEAVIRHVAAMLATERLNGDFAAAAKRLARVRAWASRYGDAQLDEALTYTHRALASLSLGLSIKPKERAAVDFLSTWESRATPVAADW